MAVLATIGDETARDEAVARVLQQEPCTIAVENGAAGKVEGIAVENLHGSWMSTNTVDVQSGEGDVTAVTKNKAALRCCSLASIVGWIAVKSVWTDGEVATIDGE